MAEPFTMTIRLTPETREFLRKRVERGDYSSEIEFVTKTVEALREESEDLDRWEKENVVTAHEEFLADPSAVTTAEELERDLAQWRHKRLRAS